MSVCEGCNADDIYGKRAERRTRPHSLVWLCRSCKRSLYGQPLQVAVRRDPLDYLPLAKLAAAVSVVVSVILAIGARW